MSSITIENGKVCIDVHTLVSSMTTDEKRQLADALACQDDIIKDVADQIITGWTDAGSHGGKDSDSPEPCYPLGQAIRAVALASGDVAKDQIEQLCAALRWHTAVGDHYRDWGFRLYHKMNDHGQLIAEPPPNFDPDIASGYEVVKKAEGA